VRVHGVPRFVVAHCRCGWSETLTTRTAAAQAAEAHCFTVAPDHAVEEGRDGGGTWWRPEATR
jgi:hypothetical protein